MMHAKRQRQNRGRETAPRGFTLLIAVILSSVVLSVGLALLNVAYKQLLLSSSAKQSQYAFYAADSALECALYYDQHFDLFNLNPYEMKGSDIVCGGQPILGTLSQSGTSPKKSTFYITCPNNPTLSQARVDIYKNSPGTPTNSIYATGDSSCNPEDPRRIERGIKVTY